MNPRCDLSEMIREITQKHTQASCINLNSVQSAAVVSRCNPHADRLAPSLPHLLSISSRQTPGQYQQTDDHTDLTVVVVGPIDPPATFIVGRPDWPEVVIGRDDDTFMTSLTRRTTDHCQLRLRHLDGWTNETSGAKCQFTIFTRMKICKKARAIQRRLHRDVRTL